MRMKISHIEIWFLNSTFLVTLRFRVAIKIVCATQMLIRGKLTNNTVPGALIGAARHNRPSIMIYGGTIQPGERHLDCPAMVSSLCLHTLSQILHQTR